MAATILDLIALTQLTPSTYVSLLPPEKMGNAANIAYGGCAMAVGINAACLSVGPSYRLYSALGSYLGPALTDRILHVHVRVIRDTRTFATRLVEVSQMQDSGTSRPCMTFLADFQVPERATLMTYSTPPSMTYTPRSLTHSLSETNAKLLSSGTISPALLAAHDVLFALGSRFFSFHECPESVFAQNLRGMAKHAPTTQDSLHVYNKTSAGYLRCKAPLSTHGQQMAALAFVADGALSFLPMGHANMSLGDAAACSSLEFALRVFGNEVKVGGGGEEGDELFREMKTVVGGVGRTYSEARFWNSKGDMVASMTQQCILRPWPDGKKQKKGEGVAMAKL